MSAEVQPYFPKVGDLVVTRKDSETWSGTIVATAKLDASLAKLHMSERAALALKAHGDLTHAFCLVAHLGGAMSLNIWSTRWPDVFARVAVQSNGNLLDSLAELIVNQGELIALEDAGRWDLEAVAEQLTQPFWRRPQLQIVGGTDYASA